MTAAEPHKICRDCRWCHQPGVYTSSCFHDLASVSAVDFVSGQERPAPIYCTRMRSPAGPCGVEARLFEPREATP